MRFRPFVSAEAMLEATSRQSQQNSGMNSVPDGGTTGQVLAKQSGADGDTYWKDDATGGGGGTSIAFFQVQDDGTTGQLTTDSAVALAGMWGAPTLDQTGFTWNGTTGTLEIDVDGVVEFDVQATGWNNLNNRHELHVQIYKNGTTVLIEDSNYASRNNTQDEGSADIHGFKDSAVDGDTYQIRVFDVGVAATVGAANVAGMTYISAKLYT